MVVRRRDDEKPTAVPAAIRVVDVGADLQRFLSTAPDKAELDVHRPATRTVGVDPPEAIVWRLAAEPTGGPKVA